METFVASLLERLLATSLQAALLVAVVWLLCRCVPRLSPATQCWLWWLVALQVVVGLCVDPLRLPWLPQAAAAVPVLATVTQLDLPATARVAATSSTLTFWQTTVFAWWVAGFAVLGWSTLRNARRTRALLKHAVPCADEEVLRAVAQAAASRGLRRAPQLRVSDCIDSPMVLGQLRPALLLPAETSFTNEELEMAMTHEMEHLRRADLWWGFVPALARHCFFFHPLVHLAAREYGIAREAACDAAVVDAGDRSRHDYGQLLLRLGTAPGSATGLAAASLTYRALSRRLSLLQTTSFLPRAGSVAVLVLALAGVMPLRLIAAAASPEVAPEGTAIASTTRSPPLLVFKPDIRDYWPAASLQAGEEGVAKVRLCMDEAGRVNEVTVAETSGFARLDEAAVLLARRFRFKPGEVDGRPQPGCLLLPVKFNPKDAQPARYTGQRMSAKFQDVPVRTVLQLISDASGRAFAVDAAVPGNITLNIDSMPWDQLLDLVVSRQGLEKRMQGNQIVIAPARGKTAGPSSL